ncbi:uncharacterized protein LOC133298613 [Gastrolobium bilobum]|uniref:uncharacterized protein LOC133298613 n=1 Tax=Gastrolobium bilobum TaxID=150636 RepID=UPI002AB12A4F|nr:uncharacterized protein LOC133298613 [Gastrolobium bilobum]
MYKYDFLKDVSPVKEDWRIKVKVVRAWKVPNFQRKDQDDNVGMVLLDEQGGRIHATVKGSLPVRKKIHEGDCYFIKKIGVGFNSEVFRPTRHQYRLSFNLRTDLRSIVDSNICASEFDFVNYDIIEKETSDSPYLVDVIGLISGIGEVCERVVSCRKTKMVVLELDNLSLTSDGVESSLRMTQLSTQSSYSYENDFLKETEKKSISDVKLCGEVTTCITYGTIKSVESKYNWWYKSCKKCPFSVLEDFEKFSVQVRVVDNTDSTSFLLFDRDCVSLLRMSAAELRELHFKRGANLDQFLDELNVLNEKSMLFKLNIKQKDLNSYSEPTYQVSKICSNEKIISSFLESLNSDVNPDDEANFEDARENEGGSSGPEKVADVESQTCDSTDVGDISLTMLTPLIHSHDSIAGEFNLSAVRIAKKIKLEKEQDLY